MGCSFKKLSTGGTANMLTFGGQQAGQPDSFGLERYLIMCHKRRRTGII
jgi:hypothetical protein